MSDLSYAFTHITLSGFSASSFDVLFFAAKKVLDDNPKIVVRYEFNGYYVVVNNNTINTAWDKFVKKEFEKIN